MGRGMACVPARPHSLRALSTFTQLLFPTSAAQGPRQSWGEDSFCDFVGSQQVPPAGEGGPCISLCSSAGPTAGSSEARWPPLPPAPLAPASLITGPQPVLQAVHVSRAHAGPHPCCVWEVGTGRRRRGMAGRFLLALAGLALCGLWFPVQTVIEDVFTDTLSLLETL